MVPSQSNRAEFCYMRKGFSYRITFTYSIKLTVLQRSDPLHESRSQLPKAKCDYLRCYRPCQGNGQLHNRCIMLEDVWWVCCYDTWQPRRQHPHSNSKVVHYSGSRFYVPYLHQQVIFPPWCFIGATVFIWVVRSTTPRRAVLCSEDYEAVVITFSQHIGRDEEKAG